MEASAQPPHATSQQYTFLERTLWTTRGCATESEGAWIDVGKHPAPRGAPQAGPDERESELVVLSSCLVLSDRVKFQNSSFSSATQFSNVLMTAADKMKLRS